MPIDNTYEELFSPEDKGGVGLDALKENYVQPKAMVRIFYEEKDSNHNQPSVPIDLDTILQTQAQCFGITDSGKTNTGADYCEALLDYGIKICVFDSAKQDFKSLPELYPTVEVVGFDGDPKEVAKKFYHSPQSLVFDNRGIERAKFMPYVLIFLRSVFQLAIEQKELVEREEKLAKKEKRPPTIFNKPIKIFIDEAQDYLPSELSTVTDATLKNEIKMLIQVVENIHRQGRAYGVTMFLMCQRPTDMITSIRSQTGMYCLHRQLAFTEKDYYLKIIPSSTQSDRDKLKQKIHSLRKGSCYLVLEKETRLVHAVKRKTKHGSPPIGLKDVRRWTMGGGSLG